jgi:hypothetical protein
VRRSFVRSMRGHAQSEPVVPWRGYVLWVGGTLLVLFFAADAVMPPPAASRYFSATAKMPTIRIHSEVKGPEAVTIDTSGFVRPELRNEQVDPSKQSASSDAAIELQASPPTLMQTEVSGNALAVAPAAAIRETFAQLAPRADMAPGKQRKRRRASHSERARIRKTQPH